MNQFTDVTSFGLESGNKSHRSDQDSLCLPGQNTKVTTMNAKSLLSLLAGSFLLLGCAGASNYPITGETIGAEDQVKFMEAPNVMPR